MVLSTEPQRKVRECARERKGMAFHLLNLFRFLHPPANPLCGPQRGPFSLSPSLFFTTAGFLSLPVPKHSQKTPSDVSATSYEWAGHTFNFPENLQYQKLFRKYHGYMPGPPHGSRSPSESGSSRQIPFSHLRKPRSSFPGHTALEFSEWSWLSKCDCHPHEAILWVRCLCTGL